MWPDCSRDPEGLALLQAAVSRPLEHTPRLMLADWLQERGEEEVAGAIRDSLEEDDWVEFPETARDRWYPLNAAFHGWTGTVLDDGLPLLKRSSDLLWLTALDLSDRQVTSTALKKLLSTLQNLITLSLRGMRVTSAVLKALAPIQKLTALDLSRTPMTDERLEGLPALKNLATLDLWLTHVGGVGLNALVRLQNLTTLSLGHTNLSDEGLAELVSLQRLTTLDLRNTNVTDVGLKELEQLPSLAELNLCLTQVTEAGVKALQQSLPKCKIIL